MKFPRALLLAALSVSLALPFAADAKRLGSGKPAGMQRDMPARTAPDAAPGKPATPTQQAAPSQQAAPAAAAAPAATPPKRNWMGPLAGIAAGLGIAALLSHFGLGEAAASFFTTLLMVAAVAFVAMFLWRRFGPGAKSQAKPAFAGMGAGQGPAAGGAQVAWPAAQQPAAAPVMERTSSVETAPAFQPAAASAAATAAVATAADPVARAFVPSVFDSEGFVRIAKLLFIRLQAANDAANLDDLRRFTTPELFASIRLDLQDRGNAVQHTDVQQVDAEVLDVAQQPDQQVVSVRFHGRVVEAQGAAPEAFNEVWHFVRAQGSADSDWRIAGIEPLAN